MRTLLHLSSRLFALSLLAASACAPVDDDGAESTAQAITDEGRWTQWFGTRSQATQHGPTLTEGQEITQLDAYEDGNFLYGLRIHWGDVVQMYGHTNNLSPNQFLPAGGIHRIDIHRSAGVLRGMRMYPGIGSAWSIGSMGPSFTTAFDETPETPNANFRNLRTSSLTVTGVNVLCAVRFEY